ncbi:hypothetical protein ASPBRDRAFT_49337 [Aspergillus brasiliensis CBS 101740]|uniref:Uncharacterized protein n=1 Tax=Aspergillus brasiliensis (strain CBS 101740 / IMI 381727 / IBT 21946) TaxID=767769 RepID=A0A1L9U2V9_ASPBC|nr:hypothetical protein ASPBRDRAFT_49337 [Aspergillus brasiliensis CBS 101740]
MQDTVVVARNNINRFDEGTTAGWRKKNLEDAKRPIVETSDDDAESNNGLEIWIGPSINLVHKE